MQDLLQTDKELIQLIAQGDKGAFKTFFNSYYKSMLVTAIRLLKDENIAKDVTQDVFLQIWKNRSSLNIKTSIIAYLKKATINRSLNQIKSRKNFTSEEVLIQVESTQVSASEQLEASELEGIIKQKLDNLPPKCRLIFVLRRIEGLRVKEIAEKLDISPKTVENQITKALRILQKAIAPFVDRDYP